MSEPWKGWEGRVVNGKFPLQRYLGGSDHSAVFLTECGDGGDRRAAIKLVRANPKTAEDQLSRWRLAAQLSDPGLIHISEAGRLRLDDTDLLYLVMEYADEDLSQILPQRPLTPQEAQEMLNPVLNALAFLHSKGLAHGSVKPANIMAVADRVKLSSDSLGAAQETNVRGMSRDAPPETPREPISPAADVWALGMAVVEALTQRLPVRDPVRPEVVSVPDGMPEPFLSIARLCLQADPKQRGTVADVATRLKSAQFGRTQGTSSTAMPREKKLSAKWPYWVAAAAVALVALAWVSGSRTKTSDAGVQSAQPEPSAKTLPAQEPRTSASPPPVAPVSHAVSRPKATPALKTSTAPPGVTAGVIHSVIPDVPPRARRTIQGRVRVRVRVQVDTSGNVVSAVLDSPGPSNYFSHLALDAARGWKFAPAQTQDQSVASAWTLGFAFGRVDTEVVPKQTSP